MDKDSVKPSELAIGLIIDRAVGDPSGIPHPVNAIYLVAQKLEGYLRPRFVTPNEQRLASAIMTVGCMSFAGLTAGALSKIGGKPARIYLYSTAIATKSLLDAADSMYKELSFAQNSGELKRARYEMSMYVGRETRELNIEDMCSATIETVAENTNDGIVAPLFWAAVGNALGLGPSLVWAYKAVSTLDSLYGYKNEKNLYFGSVGAHVDDLFAYIPARLSAGFAVVGSLLAKEDAPGAIICVANDHKKHASPNAPWPEAAFAGALNLEINGPHVYNGKLWDQEYINKGKPRASVKDIKRARNVVVATAAVATCCIVGGLALFKKLKK